MAPRPCRHALQTLSPCRDPQETPHVGQWPLRLSPLRIPPSLPGHVLFSLTSALISPQGRIQCWTSPRPTFSFFFLLLRFFVFSFPPRNLTPFPFAIVSPLNVFFLSETSPFGQVLSRVPAPFVSWQVRRLAPPPGSGHFLFPFFRLLVLFSVSHAPFLVCTCLYVFIPGRFFFFFSFLEKWDFLERELRFATFLGLLKNPAFFLLFFF